MGLQWLSNLLLPLHTCADFIYTLDPANKVRNRLQRKIVLILFRQNYTDLSDLEPLAATDCSILLYFLKTKDNFVSRVKMVKLCPLCEPLFCAQSGLQGVCYGPELSYAGPGQVVAQGREQGHSGRSHTGEGGMRAGGGGEIFVKLQ